MFNKNKTKIIATLGPSSSNLTTLTKILNSGVDAIRLNASHEPRSTFGNKIRLIRKAAKEAGKPICILLDLAGPKIRIGTLKQHSPVNLIKGEKLTLTPEKIEGTAQEVSVTFPNLSKVVKKGDPILIDDGRLELKVFSIKKSKVICHVVVGGQLKERKGVNLPGLKVSIPSFTTKDRLDLVEGLKQGIDAVALSFVQTEKGILRVQRFLTAKKSLIPVIAKIEKPQAVEHFDSILKASDGIMIARGDLGIELPAQKVPMIQKNLILRANAAGIPIITATQMLESMIENARPTRAESSDVANAVLDGTDAVMLSGETASGKYPVKVSRMMSSIITEVEQGSLFEERFHQKFTTSSPTHAIASASSHMAFDLKVSSIVVFTNRGKSALLLSKFRPKARIFALTPDKKILPTLALLWGVTPYYIPKKSSFDLMISEAKKHLKSIGILKSNEKAIFMSAAPELKGPQNWIKIEQL